MENAMTETWSKPRKAYQLWTEIYRPQGKTQKQLADNLGVSHQLIRRYIMMGRREEDAAKEAHSALQALPWTDEQEAILASWRVKA